MKELRVSVATFNQVIFPHPENGTLLLTLERRATVLKDGSVIVRAQPFGGGVKLLNSNSLKRIVGEIQFDSYRSKQEQDFRILIDPSQWEAVKGYCLLHLQDPKDLDLETTPVRELVEEFEETMGVVLKTSQYTFQPIEFVIENRPAWTENWYARGFPTVRIYRTYNVEIVCENMRRTVVKTSELVSDEILGKRALENGTGRANSVLVLPLDKVRESFLALPLEKRFNTIEIDHHMLDESVLVVLEDIEVPQYQRMK